MSLKPLKQQIYILIRKYLMFLLIGATARFVICKYFHSLIIF